MKIEKLVGFPHPFSPKNKISNKNEKDEYQTHDNRLGKRKEKDNKPIKANKLNTETPSKYTVQKKETHKRIFCLSFVFLRGFSRVTRMILIVSYFFFVFLSFFLE